MLLVSILFLLSCGSDKKRVLHAILDDDLSALHLNLYSNNSFKLVANTMFSDETFQGKYNLIGDTIIFLDPPYDNDFIPRRILVHNDKLILKYNSKGKMDTSFASFFRIRENYLSVKEP